MANNHFNAWIYGEVQGSDPGAGAPPTYSRIIDYTAAQSGIKGFPSQGVLFHPLSPVQTIGGISCAAIIEIFPTGLNVHSRKYATDATVATLTTAAT